MTNMGQALNRVNFTDRDGNSPPLKPRTYGFFGKGHLAPAGVQVCQVHGTEIVNADEVTASTQADGMVTGRPGTCLVIKTADCLPVLIHASRQVAAVHAGWRGLAAGILYQVKTPLQALGAPPETWQVVLGPAICSDHFEVGPEVIAAFEKPEAALAPQRLALCTRKGRGDRWHVDLKSAAILQLLSLGVKPEQIHVHPDCTVAHEDLWHSYRRDSSVAGRIYSWIKLD